MQERRSDPDTRGPLAGLSIRFLSAGCENEMMTSTPMPREPDPKSKDLADEHARLLARTAELEAEYTALREQPVRQDEHRAFIAKLQAHINALHEHIRRTRAVHS